MSRRALVAGAASATAAAGTAGCLDMLFTSAEHDPPDQVSLSIKTMPADEDVTAVEVGRRIAENLETAGVETRVGLKSEQKLLQDVLWNHDFDVCVLRHPGCSDPDELRPLCHSLFGEEPGWQNPFGFTSIDVDDVLEMEQGASGAARHGIAERLQAQLIDHQPFSVVAFPDHMTAVRTDLPAGWIPDGLRTPLDYLAVGQGADRKRYALRVALADAEPTENRNPLAVTHRTRNRIVDLLYDPVGRRVDGTVRPWLAESWEWTDEVGDPTTVRVRLRPSLSWHDGESLTASDVAFTYRFLADTSLGTEKGSVPAPRFRGHSSLFDGARVEDDRTVVLSFGDASVEVARRALTAPVLPEHLWRKRAERIQPYLTKALVWENPVPVGSGPFAFESAEPESSLTFVRFDDHFLRSEFVGGAASAYAGAPAYERLEFTVVPSGAAAIELIRTGDLDATATSIEPRTVPRANRESRVRILVERTDAFYLIAFNTRRSPLSNPRFRKAVARLVDREHVVDDVMNGYGSAADSPLARTDYLPSTLSWDGTSELGPFPGEDGSVDTRRARSVFQDIGYRYDRDGRLLRR